MNKGFALGSHARWHNALVTLNRTGSTEMFRRIKIAVLSAVLGLGTLAAAPATAQADGIYFSFGSQGASAGIHVGNRDRHHRAHRPHRKVQACTPAMALQKAKRMGLRNARVVRSDRRVIRISGHKRHGRSQMVFARAPHCPIIRAL